MLDVTDALGRGVPALRVRIEAQLAANPPLTTKALALNGQEVMSALGVGPSPVIGQATAWLLERVLDDPTLNTKEGLRRLLEGFSAAS